jgi:hypothetical protein
MGILASDRRIDKIPQLPPLRLCDHGDAPCDCDGSLVSPRDITARLIAGERVPAAEIAAEAAAFDRLAAYLRGPDREPSEADRAWWAAQNDGGCPLDDPGPWDGSYLYPICTIAGRLERAAAFPEVSQRYLRLRIRSRTAYAPSS